MSIEHLMYNVITVCETWRESTFNSAQVESIHCFRLTYNPREHVLSPFNFLVLGNAGRQQVDGKEETHTTNSNLDQEKNEKSRRDTIFAFCPHGVSPMDQSKTVATV